MTPATAPGSSESATRSTRIPAAGSRDGAPLARLAGSIGGGIGGIGLLRVVGLLMGLLLISAGCGPPS